MSFGNPRVKMANAPSRLFSVRENYQSEYFVPSSAVAVEVE